MNLDNSKKKKQQWQKELPYWRNIPPAPSKKWLMYYFPITPNGRTFPNIPNSLFWVDLLLELKAYSSFGACILKVTVMKQTLDTTKVIVCIAQLSFRVHKSTWISREDQITWFNRWRTKERKIVAWGVCYLLSNWCSNLRAFIGFRTNGV